MNEFVKKENLTNQESILKTIFRFYNELYILKYFFLPLIITGLIFGISSRYTIYYLGKLVEYLENPELPDVITHHILYQEATFPLSISFLWILFLVGFVTRYLGWIFLEIPGFFSTLRFHQKIVRSISNVRTTYFDENPSGRLINRLVSDYFFASINFLFPTGRFFTITGIAVASGYIIYQAHHILAFLILPLFLVHFMFQVPYSQMLSHARFIRSILLGSLLHRQTDLIEGKDVFKFYSKEDSLIKRFYSRFRKFTNIELMISKLYAWGYFWGSFISMFYEVSTYIVVVMLIYSGSIDMILGGVVLTIVFSFDNLLKAFAMNAVAMSEYSSNIKRVFEIFDLPHEVCEEMEYANRKDLPEFKKEFKPSVLKGDIIFEKYTMSYRKESDALLKDLSFTIPYGQKTGLIGRTGAGKTTLMQSLFRMVYKKDGDIKINGISIYDVEISFLRSHFGVVPQDPYLFSGTVRSNITGDDNTGMDRDIYNLFKIIDFDVNLDTIVQEGGKNFSLGERQLLCIIRVIISDRQYILLDEPTSSTDSITEHKIQMLFGTYFKNRTVVTIAHRLESLKNNDLIIELKDGRFFRSGVPDEIIPLILSGNNYKDYHIE